MSTISDPPAAGIEPLRTVGQDVDRVDATAKVTGEATYTGDLSFPGALHAALVRATKPHGRVTVSTEAAAALPGVVRVMTAADLAQMLADYRFGPAIRDMPLLADGVVRFEGEPVAMVIAETPAQARAAVQAVQVEIEPLPVIATVEEALRDDTPRLHTGATMGDFAGNWAASYQPERNIAGQYHDLRGDPVKGMAESDRVFEHEYRLPPLQHYAMENHIAVAVPEADHLTVYTPNQYPFLMVRALSRMLGWPESRIRVVVPLVGGSFGSKEYVSVVPLAAAAAVAVGRPVRLELAVEESFRASSRHGAVVRYKTGILDGRIHARQIELLFDTGAYADQGPRVVRQAGYRSPGPYRIPHLQVDAYAIYTNKVPAGAYRGFGASQPIFGCESHMDEIAIALGVDPVQWRLDHLLGLGDEFSNDDLPLDCDLPHALRLAAETLQARADDRRHGGRRVGVGFAVGAKNTASGRLPSQAVVRLHADGSATVLAAGVEIGQGSQTMLTQVVAEALGCPMGSVRVGLPDTASSPFDQRTSSSRLTVHLGLAAQRAALDARRQLLELAAKQSGAAADDLELADGVVTGPDVELTCAAIIGAAASGAGGEVVGTGSVDQDNPTSANAFGQRAGYWEGSIGAARVAVDPETGVVEVLDYVTVADAGRVINPRAAHGQELGGVVMAIGHALTESLDFDEGYLKNPSPIDYRLPLITEAPQTFDSLFLERGDGPGPYGSKGLGESSIITVAPAIANAVADATGGRLRDLPLRPWQVWEACRGQGTPCDDAEPE